jgi:5'-nucleotidase
VVALSSRALFDFEEENRLFEAHDDQAYMQLQLQRLDVPARPGVAFSLARKLLAFNTAGAPPRVSVVVLSRNDPVSGLRVFRSCRHHGLDVQRGVFTRGAPPWHYLQPLGAQLFLSTHADDTRQALAAGVPAARVHPTAASASAAHPQELRIAFDGDAVLFSDEAERVYQRDGLDAFQRHEAARAAQPLGSGPLKPLLQALAALHDAAVPGGMRVRTALVTARSAPAHERAVRTLMNWQLQVDEAMFLGGLPKAEFLRAFAPDFFFDDQLRHTTAAAAHVPSGHVAHGVMGAPAHEPTGPARVTTDSSQVPIVLPK